MLNTNRDSWTDQEISILNTNIDLKIGELLKLFPDRPKASIASKRYRLKQLKNVKPRNKDSLLRRQSNEWTKEEDEILLNNQHLHIKEVYKLLPNTNRTPDAVYRRNLKLIKKKTDLKNEEIIEPKTEEPPPVLTFASELKTLEADYKWRLKEIEDIHFEDIRELERNHESLITNLKNSHRSSINELEKKYAEKLKSLEDDNQGKFKEVTSTYRQKLLDLETKHERLISDLKQKYAIQEEPIIKKENPIPLKIETIPQRKKITLPPRPANPVLLEKEKPIAPQKEEENVSQSYNKAVKELDEIYKSINEPIILNEKKLIIGEILYLISAERDLKKKESIEKGIVQALMTKPYSYWDNGKYLKLYEWMNKLQILGESVKNITAAA